MSELRLPTYIERISPGGMRVPGVGAIHSPLLRDILGPDYGYQYYQYLLSLATMTPAEYVGYLSELLHVDNMYESLTNEQKNELNMFALLTTIERERDNLIALLSLFIYGPLEWDAANNCIWVNPRMNNGKKEVDGSINENNYSDVLRVCLRMVNIEHEPPEVLKFKNESARKFYEDFQKKKAAFNAQKKPDKDFELPNIISALCTFHSSLNYTNIFDLSICQLYDTFSRQIRKMQNDIHDHNYAVWGGDYKPRQWFERLDAQESN